MSVKSPKRKKVIKHIRRGLSIYMTGRSPYWQARIYDPIKRKYIVRSTKETKSIEARGVADEIQDSYKEKQNESFAKTKDLSFETYASRLDANAKALSKGAVARIG